MADFNSDYYLVQIEKWGTLALIFAAIIYIISQSVKFGGKNVWDSGKRNYMWIFAGVSYLVVLVGSLIRDAMSDDDKKGESLVDFLPNLIITTLWYIYIGIALGYKLLDQGSFGSKLSGGSSSSGVKRSSEGVGITLGEATDKIKILMYMGISITLINVFSNLYVYYKCKEGGCSGDDETMITSLIGAQYNIIVIGLTAIIMFIIDVRN